MVAKVSSFDRYGNKRVEGGKRAKGVKFNEGEKMVREKTTMRETKKNYGGRCRWLW